MKSMRNSDRAEEAEETLALSTGVFVMPRSAFFRSMLSLYARPWIAGAALALLAGVGVWLLTGDVRWLIVTLMLLFIVFPMLAAFLYLSYGLRPESFVNIAPHRFSLTQKGIETVIYRRIEGEVGKEKEGEAEDNEEVEQKPELEETGRFLFAYRDLRPYSVGTESVTVPCGGGLLWLPLCAFGNSREMSAFINAMASAMRDEPAKSGKTGTDESAGTRI